MFLKEIAFACRDSVNKWSKFADNCFYIYEQETYSNIVDISGSLVLVRVFHSFVMNDWEFVWGCLQPPSDMSSGDTGVWSSDMMDRRETKYFPKTQKAQTFCIFARSYLRKNCVRITTLDRMLWIWVALKRFSMSEFLSWVTITCRPFYEIV